MQKHIRLVILVLLVASMAAACATNPPPATQSTGTGHVAPGATPTSLQPTASVSEYRSSKMGYSLKYPIEFTIDVSKDSSIGFISLDRRKQIGNIWTDAGVAISPLPDDPTDNQWYSGFDKSSIIPGFTAYMKPPVEGPLGRTVVYFVPDGNWGYTITESWQVLGKSEGAATAALKTDEKTAFSECDQILRSLMLPGGGGASIPTQ
jgi:hypothetical protein